MFDDLGVGTGTGVAGVGVVDDFVELPVELDTGGALYLVFAEEVVVDDCGDGV